MKQERGQEIRRESFRVPMLMGSPEVQGHTLKLTPSGARPKGEHTLTGTSPTTLG